MGEEKKKKSRRDFGKKALRYMKESRMGTALRHAGGIRLDVAVVACGLFLLGISAAAGSLKKQERKMSAQVAAAADKTVIVIDAGHGGRDGGKVSVDGKTYEKDINLAIAYKLKTYMEAEGITVIMTREADEGLYLETDSNKKAADLRRRIEIIEQAAPKLVVSIHQNSYHEEYARGAQTFYYSTSKESEELAEIIQNQLKLSLDPDNGRNAKANSSYYLLKKTSVPIVIVECGFLSNREEALLLSTDDYQDRAAFQIHLGIMQYLNRKQRKKSYVMLPDRLRTLTENQI